VAKTLQQGDVFYVYEHWRPDTNECFWVGKGYAYRANEMDRNWHHDNVVRKLRRLGLAVEVRYVAQGLAEAEALALEVRQIALRRSEDAPLTNYTDGGEGVAGLRHSEETRRVLREKRARQVITRSPETRAKIGAANSRALKGRKNPAHSARLKGRKLTPEHRAAISAGGLRRWALIREAQRG